MNLYNLMLLNWAAKHDEVYRWKGSLNTSLIKKRNGSVMYICNDANKISLNNINSYFKSHGDNFYQ